MSKSIHNTESGYNSVMRESADLCTPFIESVQAKFEDRQYYLDFILVASNEELKERIHLLAEKDFKGNFITNDSGAYVRKSQMSYEDKVGLTDLFIKLARRHEENGNVDFVKEFKHLMPRGLHKKANDIPADFPHLQAFVRN